MEAQHGEIVVQEVDRPTCFPGIGPRSGVRLECRPWSFSPSSLLPPRGRPPIKALITGSGGQARLSDTLFIVGAMQGPPCLLFFE